MPSSKIGDWDSPKVALDNLESFSLEEAVNITNEQLLLFLKETIIKGRLPNVSLNKEYKKRKSRAVDKPVLVKSGKYVDQLRILNVESVNGNKSFLVGAVKGDFYKDGIDMATIADWLENGTAKMKAKPHFRPVWKAFKHNYAVFLKHELQVKLNSKVSG